MLVELKRFFIVVNEKLIINISKSHILYQSTEYQISNILNEHFQIK